MIPPSSQPQRATHRSGPAILILNGRQVGVVHTRGWNTSWGFGDFVPNEAFSDFAPIFGMWSLLMHADDDRDRLSRDTIEELAKAEAILDSIKAQLEFENEPQRVDVATLTIEGSQLEWKEF
jgi:hypothetical protein